jgi:hypothetical protein
MRDRANLFRVGNDHATNMRGQDFGDSRSIACRLHNDDIVPCQSRRKCCKPIASHIDPPKPSTRLTLERNNLRKRTVNIHADDSHTVAPSLIREKRELAGNTTHTDPRSQRIRESRKGRPDNEFELSAHLPTAACPHFTCSRCPMSRMVAPYANPRRSAEHVRHRRPTYRITASQNA